MNIPPAALEAGARIMNANCLDGCEPGEGEVRACVGPCKCRDAARAACLAMIEAWPGMRVSWLASNDGAIVLPLPTEASAALEERT